jgi:hypothetical protein
MEKLYFAVCHSSSIPQAATLYHDNQYVAVPHKTQVRCVERIILSVAGNILLFGQGET